MRIDLHSNLARILLVTLPFLLTAADCGDATGNEGEAALFFSARGFSVPADGETTLDVILNAEDANEEPDNSVVTITVGEGTLSLAEGSDGTVSEDGLTITATPSAGQVRYSYLCVPDRAATTQMTADNGTISRTQQITCLAPQGDYELRLDTSDCQANPLVADGTSSCEVVATVVLVSGVAEYPRQGIELDVVIDSVTPAQNATLPANDLVLSDDDNDNNLARTLSIDTDENGNASFYIHSPELTLEQTMVITVDGKDPAGDDLPQQTYTSTIRPFNNQADLSVVVAQSSVIGGTDTQITIEAADQGGDDAAGATVLVELAQSDGNATLVADGNDAGVVTGDVVEVTLDEDGRATLTLETEEVDDVESVTITATYQPILVLPALTESQTVTINPAGALIVNTVIAPNTIRSDLFETTTATVTVEKEGNPLQNANVRFAIPSNDTDRIGLGVVPNLAIVFETTTDANGVATVQVSPTSDRIRGPASVVITVTDDDPESADVVQNVSFNIERLPILQSIVFLQADPAVIGVRGSSAPSSSAVTFQVLDDTSSPMPGVRVAFDVNATADPGASVGGAEFSDGNGLVTVVLAAGTQAGPLTVVATATSGNVSLTVESAPIAVVGGLPSFAQSYITCEVVDTVSDSPIEETCLAVVADRFTARSGLSQTLQFRSEGGSVTPSVTTVDGLAEFQFQAGEPGPVLADTTAWSYGSAIPAFAGELDATADNNGDGVTFDPGACFDSSSSTPCNLLELCADDDAASNNDIYCPLPAPGGVGCWEALSADDLDTIFNPPTNLDYVTDNDARTRVDSVMNKLDVCGFNLACISGRGDLFPYLQGDECAVAAGCLDFAGQTRCPHSGLVTLMASTRGEESFVDLNGNGIFDFVDSDGDGQHDADEQALEPFVDMPEPFLDKNGSCSRDNYADSFRLTPFEEFRNTDPFSDEDGSGDYGYINPADPDGPRLLTNGRFDRDKEIFMTTHLVRLQGVGGNTGTIIGEPCLDSNDVHTCASNGLTAACVEYSPNVRIAQCFADPNQIYQDGTSFNVAYTFVDVNGNCVDRGRESRAVALKSGVQTGAGTTTRTAMTCGIGLNGEGVRNPLKPWCDELPNLGANAFSIGVNLVCPQGTEGPQVAEIDINVTEAPVTSEQKLTFNVRCPVCGDGAIEGWEQCEPTVAASIPVGQVCNACLLEAE